MWRWYTLGALTLLQSRVASSSHERGWWKRKGVKSEGKIRKGVSVARDPEIFCLVRTSFPHRISGLSTGHFNDLRNLRRKRRLYESYRQSLTDKPLCRRRQSISERTWFLHFVFARGTPQSQFLNWRGAGTEGETQIRGKKKLVTRDRDRETWTFRLNKIQSSIRKSRAPTR